jgi:hypothetical protein
MVRFTIVVALASLPLTARADARKVREKHAAAKVVIATSFATSALATGMFFHARSKVKTFEDGPAPKGLENMIIGSDDCDGFRPMLGDQGGRNFQDACAGNARMGIAGPIALVSGAVGVAAVIYLVTRPSESPRAVQLVPSIAPDAIGASMSIAW